MALTEKEKALCDVAACTARGDLKRLEGAYETAYVAGWTTRELKDAATQLYAYCGFPKALNALGVLYKLAPEADRGAASENPSRPDGDSLARGTARGRRRGSATSPSSAIPTRTGTRGSNPSPTRTTPRRQKSKAKSV